MGMLSTMSSVNSTITNVREKTTMMMTSTPMRAAIGTKGTTAKNRGT